eukprot:TRINITY_DN15984_c0_g1_i2.p1 TRINITY_DN15984_c0_g1~~TRINITY_DN15984_c0_g1_i2.p1  ORF type:complete len:344 (+),score=44.99 TRINITY_DN15984_c0_g1_i2:107-1033(+)
MPAPRISRRDFKRLADKRAKTLARSRATTEPHINQEEEAEEEEEGMGDNSCSKQQNQENTLNSHVSATTAEKTVGCEEAKERRSDGPPVSNSIPALPEPGGAPGVSTDSRPQEMPLALVDPQIEVGNSLDVLNEKEKRKRDLVEKLSKLNDNKHNLVQILKQVLNVEEELKKRSSIHVLGARPAVPLQGEATADTGLVTTRHPVPKMSSEANFGGDLEGESEEGSNHNTQARHLQPMRSTSPSAASPLRRPPHSSLQYNTLVHHALLPLDIKVKPETCCRYLFQEPILLPPPHHLQHRGAHQSLKMPV